MCEIMRARKILRWRADPQRDAVAQNLVSAAMCEIMRARNILPEDCFEPIIFASNTLHKFKEDAVKEGENENVKARKLHHLIRCPCFCHLAAVPRASSVCPPCAFSQHFTCRMQVRHLQGDQREGAPPRSVALSFLPVHLSMLALTVV